MLKHLVLIGLNFSPTKGAGDKNFWVDLIPLITKKIKRISILSIRYEKKDYEEFRLEDCLVSIKYLSPIFLGTPDTESKRLRIFWRRGAFPSHLGVIEKLLTGIRLSRELQKLYKSNPYDHIHLMDNFGFSNGIIARNSPVRVSVSAIAYQGKPKAIYDPYLRVSYNHSNLTVVPYSLAFCKKIALLGIKKNKIVHIPWGTKVPDHKPTLAARKRAKSLLSLPLDKPLFLWGGYIQQIKKKDFLLAIEVAMNALRKGFEGLFYFAFKPKSIEKDFAGFNKPEEGILVKETTTEEFNLLKLAADIFYSPIANKNCIVAPPLTWIEVLSLGVPILTTKAGGVEEIIIEGKTGFIAKSNDALIKKIFDIKDEYKNMIQYCYTKALNSYNINDIAGKYLKLWNKQSQDDIQGKKDI